MSLNHANKAKGNLLASISSSASNIILELGKGALFPAAPFRIVLEQYSSLGVVTAREIAECTAIAGDVLTITRAIEPVPNDDTTSVQSQIARNFDLTNGIVQVSNVITGSSYNTLYSSVGNAVQKTGDETVFGIKWFQGLIKFGEAAKSFIKIGNNGTSTLTTIEADSDNYASVFLHIKAKGSGMIDFFLNSISRLTISTTGVGVGTQLPTATLDVNGSIRIRDVSAGIGKALVCTDILGNATWQSGLNAAKIMNDYTAGEDIDGTLASPKAMYLGTDGFVYKTASDLMKYIGITTQTVARYGTVQISSAGLVDVNLTAGTKYYVGQTAYTFTAKTAMSTARIDHSAATAFNNKIYVAGGRIALTYLNTTLEYDPATNTWTSKANMPTARCGLSLSITSTGNLLAFGGETSTSPTYTGNLEEYNPYTNVWTSKVGTSPKGFHSAVIVNDRLFACGGRDANGVNGTVFIYTISSNSWQTGNAMPVVRACMTAQVVNGKGYFYGGTTTTGNYFSTMYELDTTGLGTWTLKADTGTNARFYVSSAVLFGRMYLFGGYNGTALNIVTYYTPETNTYGVESTTIPTGVYSASCAALGTKAWLIGGQSNGGAVALNQEFSNSLSWGSLTTVNTGIIAGQTMGTSKILLSNIFL